MSLVYNYSWSVCYVVQITRHQSVSYPAYHTRLDTFEYVEKFVDPDFKAHETLAQLVAELALRVTSNAKLPLCTAAFSDYLSSSALQLKELMRGHVTPTIVKYLGKTCFACGYC